jgi:Ca-activated chloride channel homolog
MRGRSAAPPHASCKIGSVQLRRIALTGLVAGALLAHAGAQTVEPPGRRFKSRVDLVSITATVVDPNGVLAPGLTQDEFEVYEDGERQSLTHFGGERVPIGLGLLLDVSDSMRGQRIADARAAVARFLFDLLSEDDEFFVMSFNHAARVIAPWTNRPDQVQPRLDALRPSGGTSIYDAMMAAMPLFEQRSRQRASIVLISDGADTASDAHVRDVRAALLRSDAFVYAIAIDPPGDTRAINARVNPYTLREITDDSGGRTEVVHDSAALGAATARIADELNHQYVLAYTSSRAPDGQYHSLRVRITRPGYRVRARRGYVAAR